MRIDRKGRNQIFLSINQISVKGVLFRNVLVLLPLVTCTGRVTSFPANANRMLVKLNDFFYRGFKEWVYIDGSIVYLW